MCSNIFSLIKFVKSTEDKLEEKKKQEREKQFVRTRMSVSDEELSDEENRGCRRCLDSEPDRYKERQIDPLWGP
jgi:hypothetical protein